MILKDLFKNILSSVRGKSYIWSLGGLKHVFRGMKDVFLHTHRHHLRLLCRKHNDSLL